MVISGQENQSRADTETGIDDTRVSKKDCVPELTAGIAFLSGGQTDEEAETHLNIINQQSNLPWRVTFSYARAIQAAALVSWSGDDKNLEKSQEILFDRASKCSKASVGSL